ncbi:MAG: hypothetical protein SFT94_03900 [Pseudanabaenaceae cyanobacterium bins.68]|nr:hypothetical protein [Pseudanabaenaceae cyanobacterium bins.68]
MPKPFRLYGSSLSNATKVVLIESDQLFLAIPANRVREVLIAADVHQQPDHSFTKYQDLQIPTILGNKPSPSLTAVTVALIYAEVLKSGLLAIACNQLPGLAAVHGEDWQTAPLLPAIWQSEPRGYNKNDKIYIYTTGINRATKAA